MIVDSGTAITELPETAYSALRTAFRSAMSAYCSRRRTTSVLIRCLAFSDFPDNDSQFRIIGSVNQRTFKVLYDSGRGNIGFRPGAC
ncbi:hypothetical protein EJB05_45115, partial [Eragrostis curvula]